MKTSIVEFWSKIFDGLRKISLHWVVNKRFPATIKNYRFVERWVSANLILSIALLSIRSVPGLRWWELVAIVLGITRVWEAIIYQINVLLFDEYRAKKKEHEERKKGEVYTSPYALGGYRRIVILLLYNYAEFVFWFALFYRNFDWAFETDKVALNSFFGALHFSLVTMTGSGSSSVYPTHTLGYVITSIHITIGLFMALLILARFISLIPKPKTLDEFES